MKKVVGETIFYSIFLQVIALILKIGSLGSLIRSFLPIASGNWWYVSSYILLMLCSPAINEYFLKLNKKTEKNHDCICVGISLHVAVSFFCAVLWLGKRRPFLFAGCLY